MDKDHLNQIKGTSEDEEKEKKTSTFCLPMPSVDQMARYLQAYKIVTCGLLKRGRVSSSMSMLLTYIYVHLLYLLVLKYTNSRPQGSLKKNQKLFQVNIDIHGTTSSSLNVAYFLTDENPLKSQSVKNFGPMLPTLCPNTMNITTKHMKLELKNRECSSTHLQTLL